MIDKGRSQAIKEVAELLSDMNEQEADQLLRAAGSDKLTPTGWDNSGKQRRRDTAVMILSALPGNVNDRLLVLSDHGPDGGDTIRAVAEYFAGMSEREADALLKAAGAESVTPAGWGTSTDGPKLAIIALLIAAQPVVVRDRLSLLLPDAGDPGEEPPAPLSIPMPVDRIPDSKIEAADPQPDPAPNGPIFVVHGHAHSILHEAVRVLERATSREVVVLHEQANAGRTILEKFEHHADSAAYAVVLLTADDKGGARGSSGERPRGRQNVIFELGFFFGKLGRNRVAVLLDNDVEKPSDIDGLVYISLDKTGAWKQVLARELISANISVDYARIP
jgi:Predicted nucleotide-binding protein containing TIR-like domain